MRGSRVAPALKRSICSTQLSIRASASRPSPSLLRSSYQTQVPPSRARTLVAPASSSRALSTSSILRYATSDPGQVKPAPATGKTVALDFEHYPAPKDAADKATVNPNAEAVVVCHGLFGSKQNWRSLGRAMAKRFCLPVYALDLRNHGTSPHIEGLHYADMAADVLGFLKEHNLKKVVLIGHSMGGKVALALTLSPDLPKDAISYLVSVDMTPARGPLSKEFEQYVEAMLEIQNSGVETRNEADKLLSKTEPVSGDLESDSHLPADGLACLFT